MECYCIESESCLASEERFLVFKMLSYTNRSGKTWISFYHKLNDKFCGVQILRTDSVYNTSKRYFLLGVNESTLHMFPTNSVRMEQYAI